MLRLVHPERDAAPQVDVRNGAEHAQAEHAPLPELGWLESRRVERGAQEHSRRVVFAEEWHDCAELLPELRYNVRRYLRRRVYGMSSPANFITLA